MSMSAPTVVLEIRFGENEDMQRLEHEFDGGERFCLELIQRIGSKAPSWLVEPFLAEPTLLVWAGSRH